MSYNYETTKFEAAHEGCADCEVLLAHALANFKLTGADAVSSHDGVHGGTVSVEL